MSEEKAMTENERKKEFLMSYQKEKHRVRRLEEQLQEIRQNKISPSVVMDGMPHGTDIGDLSDYAARVDEAEQELMSARYDRIQAFKIVQRQIESMNNEKEKDVLTYRYIRGMKWEKICNEMDHSWPHTHRIHANALKNFRM